MKPEYCSRHRFHHAITSYLDLSRKIKLIFLTFCILLINSPARGDTLSTHFFSSTSVLAASSPTNEASDSCYSSGGSPRNIIEDDRDTRTGTNLHNYSFSPQESEDQEESVFLRTGMEEFPGSYSPGATAKVRVPLYHLRISSISPRSPPATE